jgi:hypothetical protein
MIGLVKAGAFEDDTSREKHSADGSTAFRTNCQRFIGHFLPGLKSMAASPAKVFIRWHTTVTPKLTRYAPYMRKEAVITSFGYYYYIACSFIVVNQLKGTLTKNPSQSL